MNWLLPGFLAGAVAMGLPVALHFLRSKPKTFVLFPTLRFLGETAIRDTRRHRLRRWLTLLLRCLIVGLLAAAFARPFWVNANAARHRAMVVAIDNSMSMQAGARWAAMKSWAFQQLGELEEGDQAALLIMQPAPAWLVPMTNDLAQVRAALLEAKPGYQKTHYDAALRLAGETLAAHPAHVRTLVWMGDEQQLGWTGADLAQKLPPGVEFRPAETAPAPARQAAIVALRLSAGAGEGLTATIRQFLPAQDHRKITVRVGGKILAQQTVSLNAGDNEIALPFPWPAGADGARVEMDEDDLPADDTAWLASQSAATSTVLLDSVAQPDYLAHALLATQKLGEGGFKTDAVPDGAWPAEAVVIVRAAATFRPPRLEQLDRFAAAGGALWIFVNGAPEQTSWLQKQGIAVAARPAPETPWTLRDWDAEHPALAAFAGQSLLPLLDVEFSDGYDLGGEGLVPIANWPDGKMALAEWSSQGRRLLLAGFPMERAATDWPSRTSFVPFAHQAVRWLGSFANVRGDWHIGDSIPLPSAGSWRALDAARPQPARPVSGSVRPEAPGLYEFTAAGVRKIYAVNTPPQESDLTPWPDAAQLAALDHSRAPAVEETATGLPPLSDEAAENQQRWWWWALALCAVIIFAELALANRTAL